MPSNETPFAKNARQIEKCITDAHPDVRIELSKLTDRAIGDFNVFLRIVTGLKPKAAVSICQGLGFTTILDRLKEACEKDEAIKLAHIGDKTVESILTDIESPPETLEDRMDAAFREGIKVTDFLKAVKPTNAEEEEFETLRREKYDVRLSVSDGIWRLFSKA